MNPGYLSFILFMLFLILAFYNWEIGSNRQSALSFRKISVLLLVILCGSQLKADVPDLFSVNIGSFVMPLVIYAVMMFKYHHLHTDIAVLLSGVLVIGLNELMHAAPIAIFAPIHIMVATLSAAIGNLLVRSKVLGLICCWAGIVIGDAVFQLIHVQQIPKLIFGDMASLDLLFLTAAEFVCFMYAYELLAYLMKRRETSG